MVDNNQTTNVKLTLEQLQQIDAVEQKLSGLNTQVNVATKNLKVVTNDTNRFAREIEAQKPVLESLKTQVEEETKQANYLTSEIAQSNVILGKLNDEINTKTVAQNKKDTALQDREANLVKAENEYIIKQENLGNATTEHKTTSETFNAKVAKLKEVIKDF